MRHFTTLNGETLGTTFCGDNGRTLMQTKKEEELMWSLKENTLCLEDESFELTLNELMDLFLNKSTRCTKEEFLKRGWKKERWEQGLSHQMSINENGNLILTR